MISAVAIVLGVALGVAVLVMVVRSRRSRDGVDSFRRQIDALSPEARRPVVDQVQNAASRIETRPIDDPSDAASDASRGEASDAPAGATSDASSVSSDADPADAGIASGEVDDPGNGPVDPIEGDDAAGGARGA